MGVSKSDGVRLSNYFAEIMFPTLAYCWAVVNISEIPLYSELLDMLRSNTNKALRALRFLDCSSSFTSVTCWLCRVALPLFDVASSSSSLSVEGVDKSNSFRRRSRRARRENLVNGRRVQSGNRSFGGGRISFR